MPRLNLIISILIVCLSTLAPLASAAIWKPTAGLSWNYQLLSPPSSGATQGFQVWDIDLVDTPVATIDALKANDAKVVCYFSAGSYEEWRPDANKFNAQTDLGDDLDGWEGERWLKTGSTNVRNIMLARLDLAVQKHCDAVDPDNMDAYNNGGGGVGLTQADAINYVTFLANAAHTRNLAIGLKNAGEIISSVINLVEFSVNEQCAEFTECATYRPFINANKPVFHVEYPKGDSTNNNNNVTAAQKNKACNAPYASGFSNIIKNINLNAWYQKCS